MYKTYTQYILHKSKTYVKIHGMNPPPPFSGMVGISRAGIGDLFTLKSRVYWCFQMIWLIWFDSKICQNICNSMSNLMAYGKIIKYYSRYYLLFRSIRMSTILHNNKPPFWFDDHFNLHYIYGIRLYMCCLLFIVNVKSDVYKMQLTFT